MVTRRASPATTADSSGALADLLERFDRTRRAVTVNFRQLVSWMPIGERATHYLHPYPAKLLPHIPAFFLANNCLSLPGDTILDPFCGSGTVLLESVLHGRNAIGADANPLARLISRVKVADGSASRLSAELQSVLRRARRYRSGPRPEVVNLDYWFYPHVVAQLARLRRAIFDIDDPFLAEFFLVCFSVCVRRVSLADPRLSVPVRLRENPYPEGHPFREMTSARLRRLKRQDVLSEFDSVTKANIVRADSLERLRRPGVAAAPVASDARRLQQHLGLSAPIPSGSVDMIITSPPYAGAQKYVRASSLSLGWLALTEGLSLRQIEDKNIGREHFVTGGAPIVPKTGHSAADRCLARIADVNPLRALIAATYLLEMREALAEAERVLKPGGHLVLVAANNQVCGREFHTSKYLQGNLESLGFVPRLRAVDAIRSRGLMTRRNKTACVIAREWVLLFQKKLEPSRCRTSNKSS